MRIEFLPLRPAHLDAVVAIESRSFPEPWSRALFEREMSLPVSRFYVAVTGEGVAGYGGFWLVGDEAQIVTLAVHPSCRSQGVGRRILSHLLARAAEAGGRTVLLEVRAGNVAAQRLYESAGFRRTGLRRRYYADREDAVLMEKAVEGGAGGRTLPEQG